jgi:hypothetical protein
MTFVGPWSLTSRSNNCFTMKVMMVCNTPPYDHAPTYQISLTYFERQKCYGPDKKILFKNNYLTLMSKVKVSRRSLQYATHHLMVPSNEGRHIVLVWFFLPLLFPLLPLLLLLLSEACPGHNFLDTWKLTFLFWFRPKPPLLREIMQWNKTFPHASKMLTLPNLSRW